MLFRSQPASVSTDPAWQTRPGLDLPQLAELWSRSDADLRVVMKGSALRRTKVVGLRRNIALAIGNGGDDEALDALTRVRGDQPSVEDPIVRDAIAWTVAKRRGGDNRVE